MATARTELIHCDNCGEDYAATYRRCPFCDAKPGQRFDDYDEPDYEEPYDDEPTAPLRGGKRLAGGAPYRRGSGRGPRFWLRIALYALSAIVILAAIWILCTYIFPKLFPAKEPQVEPSPSAVVTAAPSPSPSAAPVSPAPSDALEPLPVVDDPLGLDNPDLPPVEPDPISSRAPVSPAPSSAPPVSVTAAPTASLKLSSLDFTLSPKYPTYQMEIEGVGRAQATYEMANSNVATVSASGLITAVANGNTKLTVTEKNGNSATAIVRVSGMDAAAQTPSSASPSSNPSSAPSSGTAKLSTTDFTINAAYPDPVRLKVSGGAATGWSSSDGGVATVSENGTVTGVGNGTAKITCTLDTGEKLTCTVRVSGK